MKSMYSRLRHAIDIFRQSRRLALKAFEVWLPPILGYPLSKIADPFFRLSALAAVSCNKYPIDENLVMYEAYNGRDFAGNPYALFRHLLEREDYSRLTHVVVVPYRGHPKLRAFRNHPRIRVVRVNSRAYVRYAETCRWFINNASWKPYLIKRPGQTWVYTWHSTLLKKLAVDKGAPWEAKNVNRALIATDFFISPNRFTTDFLLSSHGVASFVDGAIAEFGYPRNDLTLNADKDGIRHRLGITENERLVVFAPTWRGEQDAVDTVQETLEQRRQLEGRLGPGYKVAVKFHTMVYRFLNKQALKVCVPLDVDANELLAAADVLVTDYSGIFFDFLVTGNPVVFFTPDRESYAKAKSGFYLDLDTLPGPVHDDIEGVAASVARADELKIEYGAAYEAFRARFVADDDGHASRRTVDLVFGGKTDPRVYRLPHTRKRILFYPGPLNPNGVTTSFLALTKNLDYEKYDVAVLLPDDSKNRVFQAGIDRQAGIYYQSVPDSFTFKEYAAHSRFVKKGSRVSGDLPVNAYKRSMGRIFYGVGFDALVNFHGYQPSDAAKLAFGVASRRKVIFLHNDLERDRRIKQPQLHSVFSTYKYYDALFCVSADSLAANITGMASYVREIFHDDVVPKLDYAFNLISPDLIRSRAEEALPSAIPPPCADSVNFMTIGRLSPEKNHLRLLDALALVRRTYPETRLFLVGDGKTANSLRRRTGELGLTRSVVFIPFMANPYPLFRACDCFVLSSDIEGQPVTILEALTLAKPIIATDIAGPRDLLKGGEGTLVAPTSEALAEAMITFIRNGKTMHRKDFDPHAYTTAAAASFAEKVLEGKS